MNKSIDKTKLFRLLSLGLLIAALAACDNPKEIDAASNPKEIDAAKFDARTLTCNAYFQIALNGLENSPYIGTVITPQMIETARKDRDDYIYFVMRKEGVIEKSMDDAQREKNAKTFVQLAAPVLDDLIKQFNASKDSMPSDMCMHYLFELEGKEPATSKTTLAPSGPAALEEPAPEVELTSEVSPAVVGNTPFAPSFDCTKATTGSERLICSDRELSKLDVDLSQAYSNAKEKAADKAILKQQQMAWLKSSLRACSDKPCMVNSYQKRIAELVN